MTFLTPAEVGRRLGKSPRAVAREILKGNLPGFRIGRTFRVDPNDLSAYLERVRVRPRADVGSGHLEDAAASWRHAAAERVCERAGL